MNTLTIKDSSGRTVSYKARVMEGTPPEMGVLYVLIDEQGKSKPASLTLVEGKNKNVLFFTCVEVTASKAYGYDYTVNRARVGEIGEFVSFF